MIRWFRSENGRLALGYMVAFGAAGTGFAQMLPHTYFLSKYQHFMQMFRSGVEVPVPKDVLELTDMVLVDCKMTERDVDFLKFFTVFGFDVFGAGSTKLHYGAAIGIPYNFRYKETSDVESSLLKVDADPDAGDVDFESSIGKKLLASIVLSERAKRFAIAREVYSCTTYRRMAGTLGTSATLYFGYMLGVNVNYRFNLSRLPVAARLIAYGVCGAIGVVTCLMINDAISVYYDADADAMAADVAEDYALGGVEYYEKQLTKNKCLRTLMGPKGEKFYTVNGNLHTLIRTRSLPPNARLDNLRAKVREYNEAKTPQ